MCLILWTLPHNNHPRIKFAFASNRDECLDRPTSCADFWDNQEPQHQNDQEQQQQQQQQQQQDQATMTPLGSSTGIICGVDRKPPRANLYPDRLLPGTWVGITTQGDLIALTDYLEKPSYYNRSKPSQPKPSRGQLCGDFLVSMAARGAKRVLGDAEQWLRGHANGWDTSLEGLNLLVIQGSGDHQCVGANREGSQLVFLHDDKLDKSGPSTGTRATARTRTKTRSNSVGSNHDNSITPASSWRQLAARWSRLIFSVRLGSPQHGPALDSAVRIPRGTVTGVSNSVFARPWRRVEIGAVAIESVLNKSLERFGSGYRIPRHSIDVPSATAMAEKLEKEAGLMVKSDSIELAWLVIEMLKQLRINTIPYPDNVHSFDLFTEGLQDRVFVPRTSLEHLSLPHLKGEYGTRSSTVVLFGRCGQAVYVEKNWYGPKCDKTGDRVEHAYDSTEGVVWWQGEIGRPRQEWRQIQGEELETLFSRACKV